MASILAFLMISIFIVGLNMKCLYLISWDLSWNIFNWNLTLIIDFFSMTFFFTVLMILTSMIFFSFWYMDSDKTLSQFLSIKLMFASSMFILIFSNNLITMIVGWDLLGITSFLLVVYYNSLSTTNSGMITGITNRVGDAGFILMISMMAMNYWNLNLSLDLSRTVIISFFVMFTAFTKSAQIPFSAWLPAAMSAPTPISALVHSSTLVTAGVYLLFRMSKIMPQLVLSVVMIFGMMTSLLAATSAMFEPDLKKIVALSTLSHIGVMMTAANMPFSMYSHLILHAFFKALLFMCVGMAIHSYNSNQDAFFYGPLGINDSILASVFLVSIFSMCGAPFMCGYFSKDCILELSLNWSITLNKCLFWIILMSSIVYSTRLLFLAFLMKKMFLVIDQKLSSPNLAHYSLGLLTMMALMSGNFPMKCQALEMPAIWTSMYEKYLIFSIISMVMIFSFMLNLPKNQTIQYFFSYMWFLAPLTRKLKLYCGLSGFSQMEQNLMFFIINKSFMFPKPILSMKTNLDYMKINQFFSLGLMYILLSCLVSSAEFPKD